MRNLLFRSTAVNVPALPLLLAAAAMLMVPLPSFAAQPSAFFFDDDHGNGHGNGHWKHDDHDRGNPHGRAEAYPYWNGRYPCFGPHDREMIGNYYSHGRGLPPGLAKRGGDLPPGLEKQLRRNGRLPPGLQKRLQPFPPELAAQFPPLPSYYSRGVIGVHAVIYDRRTNIVVDVLPNIY